MLSHDHRGGVIARDVHDGRRRALGLVFVLWRKVDGFLLIVLIVRFQIVGWRDDRANHADARRLILFRTDFGQVDVGLIRSGINQNAFLAVAVCVGVHFLRCGVVLLRRLGCSAEGFLGLFAFRRAGVEAVLRRFRMVAHARRLLVFVQIGFERERFAAASASMRLGV